MVNKIVVIGDVMLDRYDFCTNRNNPESSAPCYTIERTVYKPGGAGNVAANLGRLGSRVDLISVIGCDKEAILLQQALGGFGVNFEAIKEPRRETIVKTRVMSNLDGRYHFRIDKERVEYIQDNHVNEIIEKARGADILLISDYNKGCISENLMLLLKKTGVPIIIDPKPAHSRFYEGAFLLKPNAKEILEMTGIKDPKIAAEVLKQKMGSNILLTLGSEGLLFGGLNGERYVFPAEAKKVVDVTGAGDTVIATFTHFFSKGKSLEECLKLASKAAAISIAYPGCYQVSEKEVLGIKN